MRNNARSSSFGARVSSQSLKRAWRTSALFEQALAGHIGIRSGRIAREAATILIE
ncbi:type I-E CRISPR-associated protein Cas7/Cse4/CasC, partial [Escherichia coli]